MAAALGRTGPTLIVKIHAVCSELDIACTGLSVAKATKLATHTIGMEVEGSTLSERVDFLVKQLGINFEDSERQRGSRRKQQQRVRNTALDAFGWLNPMSWFGGASSSAPPTRGEEMGQPKPTGGATATSTSAKGPASSSRPPGIVLHEKRIAEMAARAASPAKVVKKKQTSPTALTSSKGPSAAAQLSKRAASAGASKPAAKPPAAEPTTPLNIVPRTGSSTRSPVHRMKKTQADVVEANLNQAATMRAEAEAAKNWFEKQQREFLEGQYEKVLRGHEQAVVKAEALELLKRKKRNMGTTMRAHLERKWSEEKQRKKDFVERSHSVVFEARKKKQVAVRARKLAEQEHAIQIGEAAKILRAERKEQAKATVREQEIAAREYTARIRYETRPEVREESHDLFQQQRNAAAEAARKKLDKERRDVMKQREKYLDSASQVKSHVAALHRSTQRSRDNLAETRRQEAQQLRQALEAERQRKAKLEEARKQEKKSMHDEIKTWKDDSVAAL